MNDIWRESIYAQIERVSQNQLYSKNPGYNGGICAGLSIQHILMQLQGKNMEIINPFNRKDTYSKSLELQNIYPHIPDRFKYPTILENRLLAKEIISRSVNICSLKDLLEQILVVSQQDKYSLGILIFSEIRRNPFNGNSLIGAHSLSLTIQNDNETTICTACDSNIFFAGAKGKEGCNEIIEKLTNTLASYNPNRTYLSVVKLIK